MTNSKKFIIGITGSTGVLGERIIYELKDFDVKFFKGDISVKQNVYNWVNHNDLNGIIHLAAIVPTKNVLKDKKKSYLVNYMGTKYLIDALKKKYKKKKIWFFFASSSHVYSFSEKKINEKSKIKPISYYGQLKRMSEIYLLKNKKYFKICIGRIFSFTDTRQDISFFVPSIFDKIKRNKKYPYSELNKEVRDFLSTKDIVKIIRNLLEKRFSGVINICSGSGVNLFDVYSIISKLLKKKIVKKKFFDKKNILIGDNSKVIKIGYIYVDNVHKILRNYIKTNNFRK